MNRRGGCSLVLLLVVVVLAVALLLERHRTAQAKRERAQAEMEAGLAASRVLSESFQRTSALRVAVLSGRVLATGGCTSAYLFSDEQRTVAPYAVEYLVELGRVDRASFRWDATDRVMFVELPDVTVEPPRIDLAQARSAQTGLFVSRSCGLAMQRQAAGRLDAAARERARRPDHLEEARTSARLAVAALVRAPLAAAGLGAVSVRVRLASDPRPADDRQWDVSRSIAEVLKDPRVQP